MTSHEAAGNACEWRHVIPNLNKGKMRKKILVFIAIMLFGTTFIGAAQPESGDTTKTIENTDKGVKYAKDSKYTREQVMEAMMWVESGFNEKIVCRDGSSVGILQITPICVRQCNILYKKHYGVANKYSYKDRYNKEKSIEMFWLMQNEYNPEFDIRRAVNLWNAGHVDKYINATQRYYNKVMKYLEKHYN
jgi:hypothetical protein